MDPETAAAVGAAVGALFGALGGAIGGWLTSRHRTIGAIREKGIALAEFTSQRLQLKSETACTASGYVEIVGALVTYFIHTIQHAEEKRGAAPELPASVATTINSAYGVSELKNLETTRR